MILAPILLFAYSRPEHTKMTLDALSANYLADMSELFVYIDGAKSDEIEPKVNQVKSVVQQASGFKKVTVISREENYGLARNIIEGVSDVCDKYGKVIVLEDDIVTSVQFLRFMNRALEEYRDNSKIWHINGWNYPVKFPSTDELFLWRVMICWGWATWYDRWKYFDKDPEKLVKHWSNDKKKRFDLDGSGVFWNQVDRNYNNRIDTWAVFWYASIYEKGGLCLSPRESYVRNIGFDGSGTNCSNRNENSIGALNNKEIVNWDVGTRECEEAVSIIKEYYKKNREGILRRVLSRLFRLFNK